MRPAEPGQEVTTVYGRGDVTWGADDGEAESGVPRGAARGGWLLLPGGCASAESALGAHLGCPNAGAS